MPHVEQELLVLPEHLNSPLIFSVIRVARCLAICVMFCSSLFVMLSFSFGHCTSSIYIVWLPIWYLNFSVSSIPCYNLCTGTVVVLHPIYLRSVHSEIPRVSNKVWYDSNHKLVVAYNIVVLISNAFKSQYCFTVWLLRIDISSIDILLFVVVCDMLSFWAEASLCGL